MTGGSAASTRLGAPDAGGAAGAARARRRPLPAWTWLVPPLGLLAVSFGYPLAFVITESLTSPTMTGQRGLAAYGSVLTSVQFRQAMLRSAGIAVASTAGCLVLGFVLALVLAFVPFPGSRTIARLIDSVLAFPSFLIALAFGYLYGATGLVNGALMDLTGAHSPPLNIIYSVWAVILGEITFYTPFVMRPLLASFALLDPALIESAASLGARPLRIIARVILPDAVPALLAGGSLCLVLTLNEFGIILFIGAKGVITLPMLIYNDVTGLGDRTAAAIVAVVSIAISLTLYALQRTALGKLGGNHAGDL